MTSISNGKLGDVQGSHFSLVLWSTEQTVIEKKVRSDVTNSIFKFNLLVQSELGYYHLFQIF